MENTNSYQKSEYELNDEIELKSILNLLIRNKFLISGITFLITLVSLLYSYTIKPTFMGSFDIVVENDNKKSIRPDATIQNLLSEQKRENLTQEYILNSPSVLKPVYQYVIDYYKKKEPEKAKISFNKWKKTELKVQFEKGTSVLNVKYKNSDKDLIFNVLNKISESYQAYSKRDEEKQIINTIDYLKKQRNIMSEKTLDSQIALNKFVIENRLGNIDGFIKTDPLDLKLGLVKPTGGRPNPVLNRFKNQINQLNKYESALVELKGKLTPNSETLKNLEIKVENMRKYLKRPNEILVKFYAKQDLASRNKALLNNIENNLELFQLKKLEMKDPWELISVPTVSSGRIAPNRKRIGLISIFGSFIFGYLVALIREKNSGIIFDFKQIKNNLNCKYLETLYSNQTDLIINQIDKKIGTEIIKNDYVGLIHPNIAINNKVIEKIISKKNNPQIKSQSLTEIDSLKKINKIIIMIEKNNIRGQDLILINQYVSLLDEKIIGWFYLDKELVL